MQKVAVIGGLGVDRSTPAQMLADSTNLKFVSAGDLVRGHLRQQTPMGERMNRYVQVGDLVPDKLTTDAIADALTEAGGGWVLSGFPRTVTQAVSCPTRRDGSQAGRRTGSTPDTSTPERDSSARP